MKALKKWIAMMLALGMTVGFTACGGGSDDEDESQTSQETEVKGEELTEAEFKAAVEAFYNAPNMKIVAETKDGEMEMHFADGKMYVVSVDAYETQYVYVGEVDSIYYQWASEDNEYWESIPLDGADGNAVLAELFLDYLFAHCNFTYYEFNNKNGTMDFFDLNAPSVSVKVVDGVIVEYTYEDTKGYREEGVITYGDAVVGELPPLGLE